MHGLVSILAVACKKSLPELSGDRSLSHGHREVRLRDLKEFIRPIMYPRVRAKEPGKNGAGQKAAGQKGAVDSHYCDFKRCTGLGSSFAFGLMISQGLPVGAASFIEYLVKDSRF